MMKRYLGTANAKEIAEASILVPCRARWSNSSSEHSLADLSLKKFLADWRCSYTLGSVGEGLNFDS